MKLFNWFKKKQLVAEQTTPTEQKPWVFKVIRISLVKINHDTQLNEVHTLVVPLTNFHFAFLNNRCSLLVEKTNISAFVPPQFSEPNSVVILASNDPFLEAATDTISLGQAFLRFHIDNPKIESLDPFKLSFYADDLNVVTGTPQR
jgi:hypothetical protein